MTLNGPALTKAMAAGVMTMWLQRLGVDGRAVDRPDLERLCTDIITAYRDALPQSGVAARLLEIADEMLGSAVGLPPAVATARMVAARDLREAAALISGVELPGWKLVPVEPTEAWVHGLANLRHGRSLTPRCEPPTERDVEIAGELIGQVLASAPPPPVTGDAP